MVNIVTTLKTMANKIINLNNNKLDIETMRKLYGTKINLTTGWSKATNWSTEPVSNLAVLLGDKIYIRLEIIRDSNWGAGNITNEQIGTFTCKTLGAISNAYSTYIPSRTDYGTIATIRVYSSSITGTGSDQVLTYTLSMNATHAAEDRLLLSFIIPVRPNLSYYGI